MKLKGISVLVTGASGFIGRHLVNALQKEGADIHTICRQNNIRNNLNGVKYYIGNLTDKKFIYKTVNQVKPKKIFHLGGFTNPSRDINFLEEAINVNFYGTVNLLNSLKNIDFESFVFCSTAEVYGNNPIPFEENMKPNPVSPYSISKASAEMLCNMMHNMYGHPITILRLFLIYGPGENSNRFIPKLITSLLNDKIFPMTKGEQKRDFVFVGDVVEALIKSSLSKKAKGETINISSGIQYRIKEIADKVSNILNKKKLIKIEMPYRENEQWEYCGDTSKAKSILNWEAKTKIDSGLRKTIEWYDHAIQKNF